MRVFDAPAIRNVALAGHSGAGKTQLASALLFTAGAVNRLGKVDEGTTVTDYDEEAIARKHTLGSSLAWLEWHKTKINLIDTPGVGNLLTDTRGALRVVDAVLVVVDAVSGVQVQTEAVGRPPPRLTCHASSSSTASIAIAPASIARSSRCVTPSAAPSSRSRSRSARSAASRASSTSDHAGADLPAGRQRRVKTGDAGVPGSRSRTARRETLVELVAEADDALMARFFDEGTLTAEELAAGLARAVADCKVFPLLCTSALTNVGDAAAARRARPAACPPPPIGRSRRSTSDGTPTELAATDSGAGLRVRLAHRRRPLRRPDHAVPRRLRPSDSDTTVTNVTRGDAAERLGHLLVVQGKTHTPVPELKAGDIGAVAKLKETQSGDTLADKGATVTFPPLQLPGAGARLRHRAEDARRRGQDRHARCTACRKRTRPSTSTATRRPTNSCSRARASSTSRSPSPS